MASAAPVVAVSAGVLCPMPSRSATVGRASSRIPTADGMMRARTARSPPVVRCRKGPFFPVDHFSAKSGVTTDMMVTATTP